MHKLHLAWLPAWEREQGRVFLGCERDESYWVLSRDERKSHERKRTCPSRQSSS